jgi:hypothetical protein
MKEWPIYHVSTLPPEEIIYKGFKAPLVVTFSPRLAKSWQTKQGHIGKAYVYVMRRSDVGEIEKSRKQEKGTFILYDDVSWDLIEVLDYGDWISLEDAIVDKIYQQESVKKSNKFLHQLEQACCYNEEKKEPAVEPWKYSNEEEVKLVSLGNLWNKNKDPVWESGLTPEDVANAFIHDDDYVWAQVDEEELVRYDVESVAFWVDRLRKYVDKEKDIPARWNIFVDENGEIIDGYHRMTAAYIVGLRYFPTAGYLDEGIVPQGSAKDRPLHGAPVYYYPLGRTLPSNLADVPRDRTKKRKKKLQNLELGIRIIV